MLYNNDYDNDYESQAISFDSLNVTYHFLWKKSISKYK